MRMKSLQENLGGVHCEEGKVQRAGQKQAGPPFPAHRYKKNSYADVESLN
jgi:hypothetical protein